jgi:hypothetical protein
MVEGLRHDDISDDAGRDRAAPGGKPPRHACGAVGFKSAQSTRRPHIPVQQDGCLTILEYWIPAEIWTSVEMNANIFGPIEVLPISKTAWPCERHTPCPWRVRAHCSAVS